MPPRLPIAALTKISDIKVGDRFRNDMGDVSLLAESIREIGLLQPIGLTPNCKLVFGHRRLVAIRDVLQWTHIPSIKIDLTSIVRGEFAENEIRKAFTVSERVAIAKAIEEEEKPKAKERQREAGGDMKSAQAKSVRQNSAEPIRQSSPTAKSHPKPAPLPPAPPPVRPRAEAAKQSGLGSHETYRQAAKVVEKGSPELVKAMDKGTVSINAAAKIADLPKREQVVAAKAAEVGNKKVVREAVKKAEENARPEWARGPSPKEAAKNSAAARWTKLMHDIYMVMNSIRDNGGVTKITKEWSDEEKAKYSKELGQIVERFKGWITELEM